MFSLKKAGTLLSHVNVRSEMHGEESVTAVDLQCQVKLANNALRMFHEGLKLALYAPDDDKPELFGKDEHLTVLRFPQMGPVKWDHELHGASVLFEIGVSGQSDVALEADVNKFRIEPEQGGTVKVSFRMQAHPDEEQLGRLGMYTGHELTLTVTPVLEQVEQRDAA